MCKVRKSDATQSAEGLDRRGFLIAGVAGAAAVTTLAAGSRPASAAENPYAEPAKPGLPPSNMVLNIFAYAVLGALSQDRQQTLPHECDRHGHGTWLRVGDLMNEGGERVVDSITVLGVFDDWCRQIVEQAMRPSLFGADKSAQQDHTGSVPATLEHFDTLALQAAVLQVS